MSTTSKDCPTCHRPFEKRGMHCASCGRPIKKNHKWRIDHSTVRHQDCRNVRMVPLCQSTFNTLECVLELANHPLHHTSARGVTWSVEEGEFDTPTSFQERLDASVAILNDYAARVERGFLAFGGSEVPINVFRGIILAPADHDAIDTAENEGMILRERGE